MLQDAYSGARHLEAWLSRDPGRSAGPGTADTDAPVRILVDNGSYGMQNMGDIAMLQVTVSKLRALFPNSQIYVITDRPDRLARYCSGVVPVLSQGHWLTEPSGRVSRCLRRILYSNAALLTLNAKLRDRVSQYLARLHGREQPTMRAAGTDSISAKEAIWRAAVQSVDIVVASGGGYMTDAFSFYAEPVLRRLEWAADAGKTTALLGNGIGPFDESSPLFDLVRRTLPRIDMIALRENITAPAILEKIGYPSSKVIVTGDDAVALAYPGPLPAEGRSAVKGIGINLRYMAYAGANESWLAIIRSALATAADALGATFVSAPISFSQLEDDPNTIRRLLTCEKGASANRTTRSGNVLDCLPTPGDVIANIRRCRVVVTGSYHAAVFALANGIPSVCVAGSPYYASKFCGLASQFGPAGRDGCLIVKPDPADPQGSRQRLIDAIQRLWRRADELAAPLREAAARQVGAHNAAYTRLRDLYRLRSVLAEGIAVTEQVIAGATQFTPSGSVQV